MPASNSLFDNAPSGGMTGRSSTSETPMRSDAFFAQFVQTASPDEVRNIVAETRADYMARFISLLKSITRPKILLWLSTRPPAYEDDYEHLPYGVFQAFPQLVNRTMLEELITHADAYAECISTEGLPQPLWPGEQSIDGATARDGTLENHYYPSPAMHVAAADALEPACRRFLGRYPTPEAPPAVKKFVIVAAARTGTNLLNGLLADYPGCFVGNELFNPVHIAGDVIPWRDLPEAATPALLELRRDDPVAFWTALCGRGANNGYTTIGFKLLYAHGLAQQDLLDHLAADKSIAIIHLTRRNLLRRLVSERQAYATGKWAASSTAPEEPRPAVAITMHDILASLRTIESQQAAFDAMFADHPLLNIVYEDFAEEPLRIAARAARFLGLDEPSRPPRIKHRKTGAEALDAALTDFDALRARLRRWAAMFDE